MDSSGHERVQPIPDEEKTLKKPMPVEIVERLSVTEIAQGILGPLISPLASAAIVTVFVIFMLLKREDLRNRFIHLIGGEQLNLTTQALDDAAGRVSRYLLMQLIINSTYGLSNLYRTGVHWPSQCSSLGSTYSSPAICPICGSLDRCVDADRDFACCI